MRNRILLFILFCCGLLAGCKQTKPGNEHGKPGQTLTVSIEPLRYVTERIAGDAFNVVTFVPKGNSQYRWMMMNIGYVEIRGIDASTQVSLCPLPGFLVDVQASYTYQRAQDFTDPTDTDPYAGTYGGQIAYIPWHSGSAVARLTYKTWRLNYSFIYVGERYTASANIPANHVQPWYTHDLGLGKEFRFARWRLDVSAEVNNLLDQQYEVVANYPMPGRNYKLTVKAML